MSVLTEKNYLGDLLKGEAENRYSRDAVVIGSGASVSLGEVLGRILFAIAAAVAGTNTGDGTVGTVTGGRKAKIGTYVLTCIAAATNGGKFSVVDPDGERLADAAVGEAYASEHLNFTIADGDTDFAIGDSFTVAVSAGSGKLKALNPDATDGTQIAAGIAIDDYAAASADVEGVIIARDAVVAPSALVWPAEIAAGDKATALADLKALGIITREEA